MSSCPLRIIWNARPIAWVAEAQAEATAKAGPRSPNSMAMWLAGAFGMIRGTVSGCSLVAPSPYSSR